MNFCKIVTYLLVAAYGVISVNAMFTKGSLIGTLEYTAEDARRSRPESPLSSQYNLVSHTNDIPHVEKQSEVEHHNEFLAKNSDITSLYRSNKRNFNIAFQNGEAEIKKLSDCVKQKQSSFSPPLLSDWGDDLLFSATEWDVYPTYPMESHSAGTQYNFAGAPVGLHHDHHNYYPQNFFYWENNFELMHQPAQSGALERIGLDGVAESQIEENGDFRESSITANMPLNSFFEKDLTAGLAGNSFSALSDEIRLAQQGEAKEEEKQGSNKVIETSHSFHHPFQVDHNCVISYKRRSEKIRRQKLEYLDLPIIERQQSQPVWSRKNKKRKKEEEHQSSQSSPKTETSRKNFIKPSVLEEKKIKKPGQKKIIKDAIYDFKSQLTVLSNPRPTGNSLSLFFKSLDNYADNLPNNHNRNTGKVNYQENLQISFQTTFVKKFLGHSEISISRLLLHKLRKYIEKNSKEIYKKSNILFSKTINPQIKLNGNNNFYILDKQVKIFFNSKSTNFKVTTLVLRKATKNLNYYSDYLARSFWKAIESISWDEITTSDNRLSHFEKRELFQKEWTLRKLGADYGKLQTHRFHFRKLFFVFSTLINKIFCSGEEDLQENFLSRQKAAIDFFDMAIGLIEVDINDTANYFIRTENLPLNEDTKKIFLEQSLLKLPKNRFQFNLTNGGRTRVDVVWKFIALWLAKEKYEYYKEIYCSERKTEILNFKNLFNSIFFYIAES